MTDSNESDESEAFGAPVGPDDAELSDEPPDLDELDPFEGDPEAYDDLSEFVTDEWKASTTARERVRDVVCRTTEPTSASEVAELASVSDPTARDKLDSLVEENLVTADSGENGTVYQRDPDWYRVQRVRSLAEQPQKTIEAVLRRVDEEVEEYEETYGVDSPEDLLLDGDDLDDEAWRDVSEWRTALVDRQYVKTALQFQRIRRVEIDDSAFGTTSPERDRDEYSTVGP